MSLKPLHHIHPTTRAQVGDGFSIRRAIPGRGVPDLDPFLVLDHAGPVNIPPSDTPKGVDAHPHRGFETVTILYAGELEHRDSAGNHGQLSAGDIQWMTAASGVVHEEKHGREFTRQGGVLELIQLWVNLPAKHKMDTPSYQDISAAQIPVLSLGEGVNLRLLAGRYQGDIGAACTHTPMLMGDLRFDKATDITIDLAAEWSTALYLLDGDLSLQGQHPLAAGHLATFEAGGTELRLQSHGAAKALLLSGAPIQEPVVSYGPFVMNSRAEVEQAFADYRSGKMGTLA